MSKSFLQGLGVDCLRGARLAGFRGRCTDEILSAHWQPAQIFLERPEHRELLREEQAVTRFIDIEMRVPHPIDSLAHAQKDGVSIKWTILDQMTRHRIDRVVFENDEMSAFLQTAVAIADGHLPILRRDVVEHAGSDHQVELVVLAEILHRHETAGWILLAGHRQTFG